MSESLRTIVEVLGPETIATLVESTNKIAVVAGRELGLDVTADEISAIESVKLACLADVPLDLDKALRELREIPSVAARLKEKADATLSSIQVVEPRRSSGFLWSAPPLCSAPRCWPTP